MLSESDLILMSLCIFLPTLFAIALLFFPKGSEELMRWWSLAGTSVTFVVSMILFINYLGMLETNWDGKANKPKVETTLVNRAETATRVADKGDPRAGYDSLARVPWISAFGIDYFLGIDGISMPLILLTTVLFVLSMIASWNIEKYVKGYCALFLLLETGVIGSFLALDFFMFYIFWEVMLLPMYFLIGVWGGPRREYAAIKFFLYTLLGSVFILIALLAFYFTDVRDFVSEKTAGKKITDNQLARNIETGYHTFDLTVLTRVGKAALVNLQKHASSAEVVEALMDFLPKEAEWQRKQADADKAQVELNKLEKDKEADKQTLDAARAKAARAKTAAQEAKESYTRASANLERIENRAVQSEALNAERRALATARLTQMAADGKAKAAEVQSVQEQIDGAQARIEAAEKRLEQQPFFQPWFQYTMFLLLFIGFAIKVPLFPFHTWLPDAHVEAPTPISMILAGILLKLGGYGILRIAYPICPWAAQELAWYLALFGMINIVYGAFAAMAQKDFKKLVAYSSISHMGYVILGIAVWSVDRGSAYWSWGMNGAMYQMIAHGISSAGMFFLVGVIYDRAHHRNLDNFRGLYEPMPLYGGISAIIFFAALGLPGLCGFVGEFMVILAAWNYSQVFAILAALTVVVTAAYILWTLQRVYFGTNPAYKEYPDITFRELICIVPLLVLAVVLGIMPSWVLSWMEPHVTALVDSLVVLTR